MYSLVGVAATAAAKFAVIVVPATINLAAGIHKLEVAPKAVPVERARAHEAPVLSAKMQKPQATVFGQRVASISKVTPMA